MSITKAAIGTMYHIHKKQYPRNKKLEFTTIGKALNMRVGKDWKEFQFNDFRDMVEADKDLRSYSLSILKGIPDLKEDEMVYSDHAYQLLASNMPDVAVKFGKFINDESGSLYTEIDKYENEKGEMEEHILWFRKGKGWKWEHTKSGEPLGPHGLHMTKDTAERFGELAKKHMCKEERTSCENWFGIGKDEFTHYWNGWFFTKHCAYAVGYVVQVLAILPNGVVSQLYEEDWGNPMDKQRNHKRWKFIKDIEAFQNYCEEKTGRYLSRLKQPPKSQRGASIIMPSGSGKSYYIDKQNKNGKKDEFIDCDPLTWFANAQPHTSNQCPWNWDDHLKLICLQVDMVVAFAKEKRFWVMGASWWNGDQVNAIVILDETIHRDRLSKKTDPFEDNFYDVTVKANIIPQLKKDSEDYDIPVFPTILECVEFIRKNFIAAQLKF